MVTMNDLADMSLALPGEEVTVESMLPENTGASGVSKTLKAGKKNRAATALLKTTDTLHAPAYTQEKTYGHVIAKTIIEVDKFKHKPERSSSLLEKMFTENQEANQSILQSVFNSKGAVVSGKT